MMSPTHQSSARGRRGSPFVLGALAVTCVAAGCSHNPRVDEASPVAARRNLLLDPDTTLERRAAPDTFDVRFSTTRGPFVVRVVRGWAPRGADRLFYLVTNDFYDGARFFRVLPRFAVQWGAPGDPRVNKVWETRTIRDDPVRRTNMRGFVAFATAGPNTRTTQLFVNLASNQRLDKLGFAPLGRVVLGMESVDSLYGGYGEGAPAGRGPDQDRIAAEGNAYLAAQFPKLDAIDSARVIRAVSLPPGAEKAAEQKPADRAPASATPKPSPKARRTTAAAG
ncbi:MAG TPA: peptidylprolyl isomerase [Gemmatirosa sp.]